MTRLLPEPSALEHLPLPNIPKGPSAAIWAMANRTPESILGVQGRAPSIASRMDQWAKEDPKVGTTFSWPIVSGQRSEH